MIFDRPVNGLRTTFRNCCSSRAFRRGDTSNVTEHVEFMQVPAIDVHGHIGSLPGRMTGLRKRICEAPAAEVLRRAHACCIDLTWVSDLGAFSPEDEPIDVAAANRRALEAAEQHHGLLFYAVLNPKSEEWQKSVGEILEHPKCIGVKLHPRWNHWEVEEHGDNVFGFLNERRCLVQTHSGNPGSEPEIFIPYANTHPNVKLILAHLGHDKVGDRLDRQIEAVRMASHDNVWVDTSSARSIMSELIEYAVETIGSDRILFGTDTPCYSVPAQKARIAYADIAERDKHKILHENARLLMEHARRSRKPHQASPEVK